MDGSEGRGFKEVGQITEAGFLMPNAIRSRSYLHQAQTHLIVMGKISEFTIPAVVENGQIYKILSGAPGERRPNCDSTFVFIDKILILNGKSIICMPMLISICILPFGGEIL